jgi:hypothetical protein
LLLFPLRLAVVHQIAAEQRELGLGPVDLADQLLKPLVIASLPA